MKKNALILALAIVTGVSANTTNPVEEVKKEVKTDKSTVTWKAYKVTDRKSVV